MQQVTVPPEGTPEADQKVHEQEMIARVEGASKPDDRQPPPKKYANKYESVEALEQGYQELFKKFTEVTQGKQQTPDPQTPPKEEPPKDATPSKPEGQVPSEAQGRITAEEMTAFMDEYAQKGVLSKESYDKLAAKGISKEIVDGYIEGQKVLAERQAEALFSITGGKDKYMIEIEWAKDNFSKEEIAAFNDAIIGSPQQAKLAVEGLHARYTRANPNIIIGDAGGASKGDVYESRAQMTSDINDPRYQKDPAFRKMVRDKISRSKII